MRRGFKAEAERHAGRLRDAAETETILLRRLAAHLKVEVRGGHRVLGSVEPFLSLHAEQPGAFSAATFDLPDDGRIVVVTTPSCTRPARC